MKQTIAIIGTESRNGKTLAGYLSRNYRILLFSESLQESAAVLKEIKKINPDADAEIAECKVDASWEAEIIIIALTGDALLQAAEKIKQVGCQKIILVFERQEELSRILPYSKVVNISDDGTAEKTVEELLS